MSKSTAKTAKDVIPRKLGYIYVRVSSEKQVIEGQSLEVQKRICERWFSAPENSEYTLTQIFADKGVTGTHVKRRELVNMMNTVRKEDVIVVYSLSRLFRKAMYYFQFEEDMKKKGVRVISINESIDTFANKSTLVNQIYAVIAQHEAEQIRERTRHNFEEKKKQGMLCNGKPPFGYNAYKALTGALYSYPNCEEQKTIEMIIRHRDAGKSWNQIIKYLYENERKTKFGSIFWTSGSIERIYKREKAFREKHPIACDEDKLREYEAFKAPLVIPYGQVLEFLIDGSLFDHESYNRKYNPSANYDGHFYVPSYNQFKQDVDAGVLKITDETKALVLNNFRTEKDEENEDNLISLVLRHDTARKIYEYNSKNAKTLEEKRAIASNLIKTLAL